MNCGGKGSSAKEIAYHHSGATLDDLETGMLSGLENDHPVNDEIIRQDESKRLYEAISQLLHSAAPNHDAPGRYGLHANRKN